MIFVYDGRKREVLAKPQEGPTLNEHDSADSGPWVMSMDRSLTFGEGVFLQETEMQVVGWRLELVQMLKSRMLSR
jgi:hypothetical protein